MARELEAHAGRWGLFLLQYGHGADRQAVAEAIDALCERPIRVEIFPGRFPQWADLKAELARVADAPDAIQIFGLDEWLDDRSDRARTESLMRAWNVRRDGFARDVPVPVLCWLRAATLKQLARFAPDLWSWRAGMHSFAMKRSTEELADQQVPVFAAYNVAQTGEYSLGQSGEYSSGGDSRCSMRPRPPTKRWAMRLDWQRSEHCANRSLQTNDSSPVAPWRRPPPPHPAAAANLT